MTLRLHPQQWAAHTFGQAQLGDKRRTRRLVTLAGSLAARKGKSIVKSSQNIAEVEGAYRLLRNDAVDISNIAEAGFQAALSDSQASKTLLALEDTTSLNYSHDSVKDELGHITSSKNRKGLLAHSILLFDPENQQLFGLAEQQIWTRDTATFGKKHQRASTPYPEKESFKWQQASMNLAARAGDQMANIISVCDREADIYDYLAYKVANQQRFVVRCRQNRRLKVADKKLFEVLEGSLPATHRTISLPQKGGRAARNVRLAVRFAPVTISAPGRATGDDLPLYYVSCSSDTDSKLNWHLLTTEPVTDDQSALNIIQYYEHRWLVEDFHKAWKSGGTLVENSRMQSLDNLLRVITILAFIAARILQLRGLVLLHGGKTGISCETVMSRVEWKLLWLKRMNKKPPKTAPDLQWAYLNIAGLGGWYDSKRTGRAGWEVLWEGWYLLQELLSGYRLAKELDDEM